jgi:hypothetical protein
MDDYTSNTLNDSKNEWSILLMNTIAPHIMDGFRSIFNESMELCQTNNEPDKYLMTYQNLLSRIPNWNQVVIDNEKQRIITKSKCSYLEDMITCVHVIQLKLLSCIRVSNENKKITIDIPDLGPFLHKVYIHIARKLYSNIYLFEIDIPALEQQRRNREFELLVQTSIMNTIRDNLPVETILRQYIDETQEVDVEKEEVPQETKEEPSQPVEPSQPLMPIQPVEPSKPVMPSQPIESSQPSEPLEVSQQDDDIIDLDSMEDNSLEQSIKPKLSFHPDVVDNEPESFKIGDEISLDELKLESFDEPNDEIELNYEEIS